MHPSSPCFWPTSFVNINGKTYSYERASSDNTVGEWKPQEATIHAANLDLVAKFDEEIVKNYNFELKRHPAYETNELEQLNIVADIIGRIQDGDDGTMERLTVSENFISGLGKAKSMSFLATAMTICATGLFIMVGLLWLYIRYRPVQAFARGVGRIFRKRPKDPEIEMAPLQKSAQPLLLPTTAAASTTSTTRTDVWTPPRVTPTAPTQLITHSHTMATYAEGKGLVWEDRCPVMMPEP